MTDCAVDEVAALRARVAELEAALGSSEVGRGRADQALAERDARHRALLEGLGAGVIVLDGEHRVVEANAAACDMLRVPREALVGLTPADPRWAFLRPDGSPLPLDEFPSYRVQRTGAPVRALVGVMRGDDTRGWLLGTTTILPGPAGRGEIVLSFTDVTAEKAAERALVESEERLRLALEAADMGTWDWDLRTDTAVASPRHAEMLGVAPAPSYAVRDLLGLLEPADRERIRAAQTALLGARGAPEPFHAEITVQARDGRPAGRVALHGRCLRDAGGALARLVGVSIDVTALRGELDAARREAALVRRVADAAPLALAYVDTEERFRFASERYARLLDLPVEGLLGLRVAEVLRDAWDGQVAGALRRGLAGEEVRFARRLSTSAGEERELEVRYVPDGRPDGEVAGLVVVIDDVTARRRAEAAQRQQQERLALVLEGSRDGFWDWDVVTGETFFSGTWLSMLGYAPGELEPHVRSWERLLHPDDVVRALGAVAEHLAGRAPQIELEHRLRHKDGHDVWILGRGKVVARDAQGHALRACGTHTDLTERKLGEAALRRSNRALRVLSATNTALVRARTEASFLDEVCRALVGLGGYLLAWVGLADEGQEGAVRPVARAGIDQGYVDGLRLSAAEDDPRWRGPGGAALRTGRVQVARWTRDDDPALEPWRAAALARGFRASASLPLVLAGRPAGVLSVYSDREDAFDPDELALLAEQANDMAFGIEAARARVERERIAASLRESEARLRSVFQHAAVGIAVLDDAGRVVDSNAALRAMLGYSPAELAGLTLERLVAPEGAGLEPFHELVGGRRQSYRLERRYLRRSGEPFVGRVTASIARRRGAEGGALVVEMIEDLGPIRAAEARLERQAREQEVLSRLAVEAVGGADVGLEASLARALAELTGAEVTAVLERADDGRALVVRAGEGWPAAGIALPITPGCVVDRALAARDGVGLMRTSPDALPAPLRELGVVDGVVVPVPDGADVAGALAVLSRRPLELRRATPFLVAAANVVGLAWRRRDAARALERSNRLLAEAGDRAVRDERLRALGQLASGIAHDFNNHLTPILGFTDLVLDGDALRRDPEKARRYLGLVKAAAQGAAGVVARLREFYRKRDEQERQEAVDPGAVLTSARSLAAPKWRDEAGALGKAVRVELRLEARQAVAGNPEELRDAALNLLLNAVDALPSTGGTITLRTRDRGDHVALEVQDDGCGMSEEVRRRCIEPFFTTKGDRGTGLGLPQVWGIVSRHAGHVDIDSAPGRGTTVTLLLPAARQPAPEEPPAPPVGRSLAVLVVDDEEGPRRLVADALTRDGHAVTLASSGPEALGALGRGRFDLLVTDRSMPAMSGDQVAAEARAAAPGLPIVMLTGFGPLMDAADRPPGVDIVLSKPVSLEALRRAVNDALTARPAREEPA
ncbi:MAG: PAS domain S-box protein [Planctomycetes bacterium]|nr:PAS domain S-box protein [Planctomycetota bacterium]